MRKPETFDELCESLTKPFSTAKQYFDAVIISVVSSFFMIYIVGLIGINTFVDFVNDNIIQLVIGGIASIIASIVVYYKNFYKKL